jgi:hypothetical protein
MQINTNTTGMAAGLTVFTDKDGRDHCVVVVKGTFLVDGDGRVVPAEIQEPLATCDEHHGDPGTTAIKYECEFAPFKPRADVIINGQAHAKNGDPVTETTVAVEIGSMRKEVRVVGDRHWESGVFGFRPTEPTPFVTMPLTFERAFGGSDNSHPDPKHHGAELRNLVGVGFRKNPSVEAIEGSPLPNLEHPRHPMRGWGDMIPPVGFGVVGRGWQPRIKFAGTYDQEWLDERFPFLPKDFQQEYFLSAPVDQQFPHFLGDEAVRCLNMTPGGTFEFTVPRMDVPITFRFRDRNVPGIPALDTLIVEPDQRRFLAIWRASTPLGRKLNALREVVVGTAPRAAVTVRPDGKRRFASLTELIAWNRERGKPRPNET